MEHSLKAMFLVLSTSVTQYGRNARWRLLRHVGCARSFSLVVANIGTVASVPANITTQYAPSKEYVPPS
jgi:hypothetical protein